MIPMPIQPIVGACTHLSNNGLALELLRGGEQWPALAYGISRVNDQSKDNNNFSISLSSTSEDLRPCWPRFLGN
jgi:hypothetical protein